jgi:F-type H+-transporting ATPase subunit epsilon
MSLQVRVLTPSGMVYNDAVDELLLLARNGQIGILSGHARLITALDIGPMIVRKQTVWDRIAAIGGFALIQNDQVTILLNRVERSDSISREEAETLLKEATKRLNTVEGDRDKIEAALRFKRARALYQVVQASIFVNFRYVEILWSSSSSYSTSPGFE